MTQPNITSNDISDFLSHTTQNNFKMSWIESLTPTSSMGCYCRYGDMKNKWGINDSNFRLPSSLDLRFDINNIQ
jgi:hypothetical protein